MSFRFDTYTLVARIAPAVVVASPLLIFAALGSVLNAANVVAGLLFSVLCVLASEFTRDAGKKLEPRMWASWGGAPTLRRMRFESEYPVAQVASRHQQLERLLGKPLPDADSEADDPVQADVAYEEATLALRERTRDRDQFGLLFRENVAYGFRRNLLGLRPWGIAAAGLGFVASVVIGAGGGTAGQVIAGAGIPAFWSVLAGFFFVFLLSGDWVRVPAEEYADRLFGALQVLLS